MTQPAGPSESDQASQQPTGDATPPSTAPTPPPPPVIPPPPPMPAPTPLTAPQPTEPSAGPPTTPDAPAREAAGAAPDTSDSGAAPSAFGAPPPATGAFAPLTNQGPTDPAAATPAAQPMYPGATYVGGTASPPGYGYGVAPFNQPAAAQRTNGLAIASMVVSLCSLLVLCPYGLPGLLGLVGAILGHVAHGQIKDRGEGGQGLAVAGIIMGWLAVLAAIVITIIWVVIVVQESGL